MTDSLEIRASWLPLDTGTPETKATYADIGVRYGSAWLTKAQNAFVGDVRDDVPLSAYAMAEWIAWNWHRLRWEPRTDAGDWADAHQMSNIGGGYVWPNITIFSDGERIVLLAKPTTKRPEEPFQYVCDYAAIVRAGTFESVIDDFVGTVITRLGEQGVSGSNLQNLWADVLSERADPITRSKRRFEALLGFEPDEAEDTLLDALLADARALGESAMSEVAANRVESGVLPRASELRNIAASRGSELHSRDAAWLRDAASLPAYGQVPAWRRGAAAAEKLRQESKIGDGQIDNATLAAMLGVPTDTLSYRPEQQPLSFALIEGAGANGRVVLRTKHPTQRRFELARLLGDRLAGSSSDALRPATRAYTYRQKLQRSFAAEFLCPFEALREMLSGDFSDEAIADASDYFDVSDRTVRTLLMNHHCIPRVIERDFDVGVAA